MRRILCLAAATLALGSIASLPAAAAPLCPGFRGVKPVPAALQTKVAQAFGIAPEAARNSVIRCAGNVLMACAAGANLNCGKANTDRALPGATAWCRDHPDSDFIPMFATGHDTIYDWRCTKGQAVPGNKLVTVDPEGFVAENWKEIR